MANVIELLIKLFVFSVIIFIVVNLTGCSVTNQRLTEVLDNGCRTKVYNDNPRKGPWLECYDDHKRGR